MAGAAEATASSSGPRPSSSAVRSSTSSGTTTSSAAATTSRGAGCPAPRQVAPAAPPGPPRWPGPGGRSMSVTEDGVVVLQQLLPGCRTARSSLASPRRPRRATRHRRGPAASRCWRWRPGPRARRGTPGRPGRPRVSSLAATTAAGLNSAMAPGSGHTSSMGEPLSTRRAGDLVERDAGRVVALGHTGQHIDRRLHLRWRRCP